MHASTITALTAASCLLLSACSAQEYGGRVLSDMFDAESQREGLEASERERQEATERLRAEQERATTLTLTRKLIEAEKRELEDEIAALEQTAERLRREKTALLAQQSSIADQNSSADQNVSVDQNSNAEEEHARTRLEYERRVSDLEREIAELKQLLQRVATRTGG